MMHMYVEMKSDALVNAAMGKEILKEHLSVYFKYVDQDYKDLKTILGMDPLEITILKCQTFAGYEKLRGKKLNHINPSAFEIMELLRFENKDYKLFGGRGL